MPGPGEEVSSPLPTLGPLGPEPKRLPERVRQDPEEKRYNKQEIPASMAQWLIVDL